MRGAEAVVSKSTFLNRSVVVKDRISKKYRTRALDEKLRRSRTRIEARLLHRAKIAGVKCPTVLKVSDFSITMTFIDGNRPKMNGKKAREAGRILAKLHSGGLVHGDYTPANLIESKGRLFVIDFGLGYFSDYIEDKAVDIYTMLRTLDEKERKEFLKGYKIYKKYNSVCRRLREIEKRVRYA